MSHDTKLTALLDAADAVHKAFGAPGDYGYGTKQGDALFSLVQARAEFFNECPDCSKPDCDTNH